MDPSSIRREYERHGVPGLEAVLGSTPPTRAWIDALLAACVDPECAVPATWLVRAYLQRGAELEPNQVATLLRSLARIGDDNARLHLCQLVVHLDVPARNAEQLARFLRSGVEGEHKLTRAWAVDGLQRLARQHARYRIEALAALERAERDPAASVRARARLVRAEVWSDGPTR